MTRLEEEWRSAEREALCLSVFYDETPVRNSDPTYPKNNVDV